MGGSDTWRYIFIKEENTFMFKWLGLKGVKTKYGTHGIDNEFDIFNLVGFYFMATKRNERSNTSNDWGNDYYIYW